MNIVIIAHDIPFPARHGGRVDMWNRIKAMRKFGMKLHLITWSDNPVTKEQLQEMNNTFESSAIYDTRKSKRHIFNPILAHSIAIRKITNSQYHDLLAKMKRISPDIILLDGIHGAVLSDRLCKDLKVPCIYRSHNVEFQYIREIFESDQTMRRPIRRLLMTNVKKMYRSEYKARKYSLATYDISGNDAEYWSHHSGMAPSKVLHPLLFFEENRTASDADLDVLYVGNLFSANNIHGVEWFVEQVSPLLSGISITLAGSNPSDKVRNLCAKYQINLIADPNEVRPLYRRAKVLINPIFRGSGVNIKMLDMLITGKPIVSTPQGTLGIDKSVLPFIKVATSPQEFADSVRQQLSIGSNEAQSEAVRKVYDWSNIASFVKDLKEYAYLQSN